MDTVTSLTALPALGITRVALTCGVFDGLHRGHRKLVETTLALARETDAAPVLFTFHPHPAQVLSPARAPRLLLSEPHKLALMAEMGLAAAVQFPFNPQVAAMEPEAFIERELLGSGVTLTALVVGDSWRFGFRARGDVALLRSYGQANDFAVVGVPPVHDASGPISSTRIRTALVAGDLDAVERMLGRPFSIMGEVEHGKGIGTTELHYPTANVHAGNELFPPSGIYAARAHLRRPDGCRETFAGILYLGNSPTFVDQAPAKPFVEMHIFDFHENIYGQQIEVEFVGFIRPDARFPSVTALCAQIALDIEQAKLVHAAR